MFGIFEIAIGIGVFIIYKVASGWTQPAGEEEKSEHKKKEEDSEYAEPTDPEQKEQPSDTPPIANRADVVEKYANETRGHPILNGPLRELETELKNRGIKDPYAYYYPAFTPMPEDLHIYFARLKDVLDQLLHPREVATVRADPQDWNRDAIKMSMAYNPQYSRPLEVQDHQS